MVEDASYLKPGILLERSAPEGPAPHPIIIRDDLEPIHTEEIQMTKSSPSATELNIASRMAISLMYVDGIDHLKTIVTESRHQSIEDLVKDRGLDEDETLAGSIECHGPETVYGTINPFHEEFGRRHLLIASTLEDLQIAFEEACHAIPE